MSFILFAALIAAQGPTGAPIEVEIQSVQATKAVSYADIDLTSDAGLARLERRLRAAADRLCASMDKGSPAPPPNDPTCRVEAMKDAREQMRRAASRAKEREAVAADRTDAADE